MTEKRDLTQAPVGTHPIAKSRFKPQVTRSVEAPGRWVVPPHLRGYACQACGHFFQDGETHGELDLFGDGAISCTWRFVKFHRTPVAIEQSGLTR